MNRIGIAGLGPQVPGLLSLLQETGTEAVLWDNIDDPTDLDAPRVGLDTLADTPVIFVCPPIGRARQVAHDLGEIITGQHVLIHFTRELEPDSDGVTLSRMLRQETATHRLGFLTGPMRHADLARGMSGAGACSTNFPEVHELLSDILVSKRFRLYKSRDILGSELAACLTRSIAFVGGIADQLQLGPSIGSTLFTRGLAETAQAVVRLGGQAQTTFGMAGSGNLFMDIHGDGSPEFRLGKEAATHGALTPIIEAGTHASTIASIARINDLALSVGKGSEDLGIFRAVRGLIQGEMNIPVAIEYLMNLPVFDD